MKKLLWLGLIFVLACKPTPSGGGTGGGSGGGTGGGTGGENGGCDPETAVETCDGSDPRAEMSAGRTDSVVISIDTTGN